MNLEAKLTKRENEVAGMIAVGEAKKQIAGRLHISPRTVENTARNIYSKTEVNSVGQLSTWWFSKKFNISLAEIYNTALSLIFIALVCVNEVKPSDNPAVRCARAKVRTGRRKHH